MIHTARHPSARSSLAASLLIAAAPDPLSGTRKTPNCPPPTPTSSRCAARPRRGTPPRNSNSAGWRNVPRNAPASASHGSAARLTQHLPAAEAELAILLYRGDGTDPDPPRAAALARHAADAGRRGRTTCPGGLFRAWRGGGAKLARCARLDPQSGRARRRARPGKSGGLFVAATGRMAGLGGGPHLVSTRRRSG